MELIYENGLGLCIVILSLVLFWVAFLSYKKDKYSLALLLIVIAGILLRIFTCLDTFLHPWDERYHALVAKHLIEYPFKPMLYLDPIFAYDYWSWVDNHIWVHKQPFPLYSMAASMWLFGVNVLAMRFPSILLSTLSIWSGSGIAKELFNKRIGILVAYFIAINGFIIEITAGRVATDHIDLFFYCLVSFGVYFLLKQARRGSKWYLILGAIFTALAILSKWLPGLITLPIWVVARYGYISHKQLFKEGLVLLSIIVVIVSPWQVYIHHQFPLEASWEAAYNWQHVINVLDSDGHPFYYHFDRMRILYGELTYVALIWFAYSFYQRESNKSYWIILVWIAIPYLFFSIVKTKMQGYTLFTAPALFMVTALFVDQLDKWSKKETSYKWLCKLLMIAFLLIPVRYMIERVKPLEDRRKPIHWVDQLKEIESKNSPEKQIIFNCQYPIETMFYTDMTAYELLPSVSIVDSLLNEGYQIFIDNAKSIPKEILMHREVLIIEQM